MNQPSIEEKLKAIEAAINLAQARHLPAVLPPSQPAVKPNGFDGKDSVKSRELALAVLKRFDARIAALEEDGSVHQKQLSSTEAVQQEQQEALELISDEVSALKQRAAQLEGYLRQIHLKSVVDLYRKERQEWRQGYRLVWALVGALILLIFFITLRVT